MLRCRAPDKPALRTRLVQTAGGAGAARREDCADVRVAAPVRGGLGAGVGDSYRERLVAGLLDVERAGQREPGGLVDPKLALGVGGAEVLLVAARAGQDDLGAFGRAQPGRVARVGGTAEHSCGDGGAEV